MMMTQARRPCTRPARTQANRGEWCSFQSFKLLKAEVGDRWDDEVLRTWSPRACDGEEDDDMTMSVCAQGVVAEQDECYSATNDRGGSNAVSSGVRDDRDAMCPLDPAEGIVLPSMGPGGKRSLRFEA